MAASARAPVVTAVWTARGQASPPGRPGAAVGLDGAVPRAADGDGVGCGAGARDPELGEGLGLRLGGRGDSVDQRPVGQPGGHPDEQVDGPGAGGVRGGLGRRGLEGRGLGRGFEGRGFGRGRPGGPAQADRGQDLRAVRLGPAGSPDIDGREEADPLTVQAGGRGQLAQVVRGRRVVVVLVHRGVERPVPQPDAAADDGRRGRQDGRRRTPHDERPGGTATVVGAVRRQEDPGHGRSPYRAATGPPAEPTGRHGRHPSPVAADAGGGGGGGWWWRVVPAATVVTRSDSSEWCNGREVR